jgi:hypothetical protein
VPGRFWAQAVRQHHGIEHATLTVLSRRCPQARLVARSDGRGFVVYGAVDTGDLRAAVEEALARLHGGESGLAVHPNCGTNLIAAGLMSGVAALVAGGGDERSPWQRIPTAVLAATAALIIAPPVGRWAQARVTTSPQVDGLSVAAVKRLDIGPITRHRVLIAF